MHSIYDHNNLPFWSESEIEQRQHLSSRFFEETRRSMQQRNLAWRFERIEAPMLIPRELLSEEYSDEKIFAIPPKIASARHECAIALAAKPELARSMALELATPLDPDWVLTALNEACSDEDAASRWDPCLDALALAWATRFDKLPKALALRPETTPATYAWMARRMEREPSLLPYCCWQLNKSFRREQDQPSKHMRLKEFWQQVIPQ